MPYPVYMDHTSQHARQQMTMPKAIAAGLFTEECCFDCGTTQRKLYAQIEGTYAGARYCRKCALAALKDVYF